MTSRQPGAPVHDHDHGLAHDLEMILRQTQERRRVLAWLSGLGGAAVLAACGGGGSDSSGSLSAQSSSGTTSAATSGGSTAATTTTTTTTTSSSACIADPAETAGPYPSDGTNSANGSVSNVLTASGIVRSDIRSSFGSSSTMAPGLPMTLTISLVNTNASCAALAGHAIYLWHCNATGKYSIYDLSAENYLRGVQVTDSNGQATFQTIFPGCYAGRYPHIHFEVFQSLATATAGSNAVLTSQMCLPRDIATSVYSTNSSLYSGSSANLAQVTIASDNVFGDNTAAQIAAQTPALSGTATAGYAGTITVGVAR